MSFILKISRHKHLIVLKDPGEMEFIFYFIFDSSVFSQACGIIITMSVTLYSNKVSLIFRFPLVSDIKLNSCLLVK